MVKINDKYFIDADTHCYMLKEKITIQDKKSKNYGKESYSIEGYYVSIESLLKGLLKKELRRYIEKDDEKNVEDLKNKIKELREFIESLNINI